MNHHDTGSRKAVDEAFVEWFRENGGWMSPKIALGSNFDVGRGLFVLSEFSSDPRVWAYLDLTFATSAEWAVVTSSDFGNRDVCRIAPVACGEKPPGRRHFRAVQQAAARRLAELTELSSLEADREASLQVKKNGETPVFQLMENVRPEVYRISEKEKLQQISNDSLPPTTWFEAWSENNVGPKIVMALLVIIFFRQRSVSRPGQTGAGSTTGSSGNGGQRLGRS